jgi:hypothetical protein
MRLFIILLALPGLVTAQAFSSRDRECNVKEVVAVRGPQSFICRASEWPRVGPARLYVTLQGIDIIPDLSSKAQAELQTRLQQARSIRLRNIEMGSFFRLSADVEADGKDLAEILTAKGLAKKTAAPGIVKTAAPASEAVVARPEIKVAGAQGPNPAGPASGTKVIVTDWKSLLDRPVDLSSITPVTPFREALERIRTSIEPTLPMMINWTDLRQNAFIEETSPVGVDGLGRMGIGQALELICNAVDGGKGRVSFMQRGRVVIVASKQSLGNPKSLRVIDIGELTAPQSTGFGMNGMSGGYSSGSGMSGTMGNQPGGALSNMNSGLNRR